MNFKKQEIKFSFIINMNDHCYINTQIKGVVIGDKKVFPN